MEGKLRGFLFLRDSTSAILSFQKRNMYDEAIAVIEHTRKMATAALDELRDHIDKSGAPPGAPLDNLTAEVVSSAELALR